MILTTLDKQGYTRKPEKKEIAKISKRIADCTCEVHDLKEFANLVANKGYTWCPTVFNGNRNIDNFVSVQLIALDFDGGVTFDEVKQKSEKYMIPILFAYKTFSSINMNKFRVVFKLDKIITDIDTFNFIIAVFMKIFAGCDIACKDASRMFFGGKNLIYYNERTVQINILMMNFELYLKDRYGSTHYKAHVKKFISCHLKNGKNSPLVVYNKTKDGEKLPNHKKCRKDCINNIYNACQLYRELADDAAWLYYNELYGLITNLIHVETGEKVFLKCIEDSVYDTYKKDWKFYINYFKKNNYMPMQCEKFCPYCDNCPHDKNIIQTVKVKRKEVVRLKEPQYVTIEEVQEELNNAFHTAMKADDKKIHVIKAQTAIGKTHMYVEYLKNTKEKCMIAVPTNKLKSEVYENCISAGIDVMMTPSIQEIRAEIPEAIYKYIEYLYGTGKHNKVMRYINTKAETVPILKEFIEASKKVKEFEGNIITTHHRVLYSKKKNLKEYNVIIDEDILKTMIKNQMSVNIEDMENLLDEDIPKEVRKHLENIIELSQEKTLFSVKPIGNCKVNVDFDLNALLNAEKFYSDGDSVIFYQTPKLKKMKYTILSATADEYIYKSYFGDDRVVFCTCQTAKYKGKLIQYLNHSYSRRYIENTENVYEDIVKTTGDIPMITFKKFSNEEYGIHFGNSEGCNCMKGQDITVVGTPHMADFLYKLMAYQIGYDGAEDKLRYQEVTHNGFKFWFYTYDTELMRRIQFWMIESELEQSVGRARLLREDCVVHLFSDFPLMQGITILTKT